VKSEREKKKKRNRKGNDYIIFLARKKMKNKKVETFLSFS